MNGIQNLIAADVNAIDTDQNITDLQSRLLRRRTGHHPANRRIFLVQRQTDLFLPILLIQTDLSQGQWRAGVLIACRIAPFQRDAALIQQGFNHRRLNICVVFNRFLIDLQHCITVFDTGLCQYRLRIRRGQHWRRHFRRAILQPRKDHSGKN